MKLNDSSETPGERDIRLFAIPDVHGHAKGEHKPYAEERPLPLTARMLFLWFYHACRRGWPRFMMVSDHMNYLTFEDPAAVNLVRRALKLAQAGDLLGAAETANVDVSHAAVVSEGLRRGMRFSIGAEVDNDPRSRPDAQNIIDAMRPDGMIRSVHFITVNHPQHGDGWNWPFDNPEFASMFDHVGVEKTWETYMATLLDAIERLPGHIVGHFYVPAIFGHWPDDATLERYEDQLLEKCAERGMAVEFNTRFLYRGEGEPQRSKMLAAYTRLVRKAHERGVLVAIGADAHSPRDQSNGFEAVLGVLDDAGINELAFPLQGRLARVALKVERKPEPEPEPAPPVPASGVSDEAEAAQIVPTLSGESDESKPAKPARKRPKKVAETTAGELPAEAGTAVPAPPASPQEPAVAEGTPAPQAAPAPVSARAKRRAEPAPSVPAAAVAIMANVAEAVREVAATAVAAIVRPSKKVAPPAAAEPVKSARKAPAAKPAPKATAPVKATVKATAAKPKAAPVKPKAAKPAAKAAAKATVKSAAKPGAKPAAKPAAKAAAKAPARKAAPSKKAAPARKAVAKAVPKRAPAKPAAKAKSPAKPAKAVKAPARPAARTKAAPKKVTAKAKPAARATARPKPAAAKRKATKRR